MSSFWKIPGGGKTTLVFMVRIELGDKGRLVGSCRFSTVRGRELTIHSASDNRVLKDSSSREVEWSRSIAVNTFRTERIWRSHTPLMWLAAGGFFFQTIQSQDCSRRKELTRSWSMRLKAFRHSFSAPTKFLPLSEKISLTTPRLARNLLRAWIN